MAEASEACSESGEWAMKTGGVDRGSILTAERQARESKCQPLPEEIGKTWSVMQKEKRRAQEQGTEQE
jgi:putative component of membrane protein insertase Oxa1/YidC/SpoIIIJ protein YidD